jgi:hypothetical protein
VAVQRRGGISDVAEGLRLLEGSRFLRVEQMEAQCIAWLCAHVEASNCVALWAEANRLGCGLVAEHALLVMGRQLAAVAGEVDFLGLPLEALLELARSDGLAVRSERTVLEAVMRWVRHDKGSRLVWLGQVFGAVRMELLSPVYLIHKVLLDSLVLKNPVVMRIVMSSITGMPGARMVTKKQRDTRSRKRGTGRWELVVVGGLNGNSGLKSAEVYDIRWDYGGCCRK